MNDATHGADNIRNDISALAQRYAVIDRDEECGVSTILMFVVSFSSAFPVFALISNPLVIRFAEGKY